MKRIMVLAALVAAVSGCAGINRSMTYQDVKYVTFHSPELPVGFWIFDHPNDGKMLINQDPASAAGAGFAKGLTLGLVDTSTPNQVFEKGANLWLQSMGRKCVVTKIERIMAPTNYEATYSCTPTAPLPD